MKALIVAALVVLTNTVVYGQTVRPTVPGTSIPDPTKPGWKVSEDKKTLYPTIPGTSIRDFTRPGWQRQGDTIYRTIPGTSIRDFTKPGYTIKDE